MTLSALNFFAWVQDQELRSVRTHIRRYLAEKGLTPTIHEVKSFRNSIYNRLRIGHHDYPSIDYTPRTRGAAQDDTPIKFAASRELAVVKDVIAHNGFALPETTSALQNAEKTHATANVGQQKAMGDVVRTLTAEIAIKDVKAMNADELARRDREAAEEARKDKAFAQSIVQSLLAGKQRGGGGIV